MRNEGTERWPSRDENQTGLFLAYEAMSHTRGVHWFASIPFFAMHVTAVVGLFVFGWSTGGFLLALALYFVRMFGVTGGYHRYFSHRTYKMGRVMQFLMAWLAQSSAQKGVLWWASHHRLHHVMSDQPGDVHSVKQDGFFWAHIGWIISREHENTDVERVRDLAKYPELRFLNTFHLLPPIVMSVVLYLVGGMPALFWGACFSTVLLWHGTFTINSLTHVFGSRRYATTDESKNNLWLALITMGEGWHNNHHHYQRSTRQGFYWWEIDVTYYILRAMAALRLISDLRDVPAHVRDAHADKLPAPVGAPASAPQGVAVDVVTAASVHQAA